MELSIDIDTLLIGTTTVGSRTIGGTCIVLRQAELLSIKRCTTGRLQKKIKQEHKRTAVVSGERNSPTLLIWCKQAGPTARVFPSQNRRTSGAILCPTNKYRDQAIRRYGDPVTVGKQRTPSHKGIDDARPHESQAATLAAARHHHERTAPYAYVESTIRRHDTTLASSVQSDLGEAAV